MFTAYVKIKYAQKKKQEPQKSECRHLKKSSKGNIYNILQQLIGFAPQQQLLVLGMKMEIIYIHSSILQVCSLFLKEKVNHVTAYFSLSFIFFQVWHLTLFWYFFCRQKPCHLPTKVFSMILQKGPPQAPRLSIWIVAQRTLLPPFESNLKTRHYEYALDFYGHFFYSCV